MVSVLDSGSSGTVSSPDGEHCVVFLDKTLYSHGASHHPLQACKWVSANIMLEITLRWTCIRSRGSRNTTSRFMLLKLG